MALPSWTLTVDFRADRREIEYEYQDQCVTWWFLGLTEAENDALKITDDEENTIVQFVHRAEAETSRCIQSPGQNCHIITVARVPPFRCPIPKEGG